MSVRKFPRRVLILLLAAALTLTACNVGGAAPSPTLDVNAINTAIVGTTIAQFSAQFTQTALAVPTATNTPLPTDTPQAVPTSTPLTISFEASPTVAGVASPLPAFTQLSPVVPSAPTQASGDSCNNSAFVADVTIPDGTVLKGGEDFQKVWRVKNTGSCTWDEGYTLVYYSGTTPNLDPYNFEIKKSSDFVKGGEVKDIGINLTAPCTPGSYNGSWRMRSDQGVWFGTFLSVYIEVKEKCK